MVTIPKAELEVLVTRAFKNVDVHDVDVVSEIYTHLLHNEMSGKTSHGILRVKWSIDAIKKKGVPVDKPFMVLDSGPLGIVDGQNNIGLVAARYAADQAINKAKEFGIALLGVRNHFGTTGTMNYYQRLFVEAGLIGIAGCNSEALVCHPQGFDPVIGTNPISFGIPSAQTPCIIDVTTAQWAYGKLLALSKSGKPLPVDAFVDKNGTPSTNIEDVFTGAMLPMNGIKGFALGLAIEILGGALIGAKGGMNAVAGSDGLFFIVIDPDKTVGREQFEMHVEALLQEVKSSRHDEAVVELLIPGERSDAAFREAKKLDTIELADQTYQDLEELAA